MHVGAKEVVGKWIGDTVSVVLYTTHVDITHLLECGPGRVMRNDPRFDEGVPHDIETGELRHIVDWIVASLERGEEWIGRCDDKGRPLKLTKCGTLERMTHEADKAMRRWNSQINHVSRDGDELAFTFSDGYRLYKLTDSASLDAESAAMGHCVGNGAYDNGVETGALAIYSLRDPAGRSHATIEVQRPAGLNKISQIMGTANTVLKTEYMKRLVEWFNSDRKLVLTEVELPPSHAIDRNMKIVDLTTLKPGDRYDGDLELRTYEDRSEYTPPIPEGLVVLGDLTVQAHRRLNGSAPGDEPHDFQSPVGSRTWDGSETHGPVLIMPKGVLVQGNMKVHGFRACIDTRAFSYHFVACRLDALPTVVERSVVMTECHLPVPLQVSQFSKNLMLDSCGPLQFAGDVLVGGEMTITRTKGIGRALQTEVELLGSCSVLGNLTIKDSLLSAISDVKIDGTLNANLGMISFDAGLEVGSDLKLYDVSVGRMPDRLVVGGDIVMEWVDIDRWPAEMSAGGETNIGGISVREGPKSPRFGIN